MAVQGFTISGLPGVADPTTELVGALWEVEVPTGPVAEGYTNKKLTTEQYVAYLAAQFGDQAAPAPADPTAAEVFKLLQQGQGIKLTLLGSGRILIDSTVAAAPAKPPAPTGATVDDAGNIFSVDLVAGFPALSDYGAFVVGTYPDVVTAVAAGCDIQNGRLYLRGLTGNHAIGSVGLFVAASGNRPASASATNAVAFTSADGAGAATKATAPAFGPIDDTNNVVTLSSNYAYTDVRWGIEGQGVQALASNSICSPGNITGRLFAYVVADTASNRLQSDTVYSTPFSAATSANNPPTASLSVAGGVSSVTTGQSVTLNLAGQDTDGTVQKVEALDNGVKIGEITGASGALQTAGLTAGSHSFTARAVDDKNATGLSSAVIVTAQAQGTSVPLLKIAGQSNAQGLARRSDLYAATLNTASPSFTRQFQTRIWNPTASALQPLQVGTAADGTGNELGQQHPEAPSSYENGFGPEIGLAQRWEQQGVTNGVLAKYGVGGTAIARWQKAANDLYPGLKATILNARAAITATGGTPQEQGFYWCQWESDAGSSSYQADLQQLYNDLRADGLLGANELFVVNAAQNDNIRPQQQAFVNANAAARLLVASSVAYIPNDQLHYDARTQLALGGNQLYNLLFATSGSIAIPGAAAATLVQPVVLNGYHADNTNGRFVDSGGGGFDATQSDASLQPALQTDPVTGMKGFYFAAGKFCYLGLPALFTNAAATYIGWSLRSTSSDTGQFYFDCPQDRVALLAGGSSSAAAFYASSGSGQSNAFQGPTVAATGAATTVILNIFGTTARLYVNGSKVGDYTSTAGALKAASRLGAAYDISAVGNGKFSGYLFNGEVGAGQLTDAQFAALHNRLLTKGDSGAVAGATPTIVEDSALTYAGTWATDSSSPSTDGVDSTVHYSNQAGATAASVALTGSQFNFYGNQGTGHVRFEVLDGSGNVVDSSGSVDNTAFDGTIRKVYTSKTLASAAYTCRVTILDGYGNIGAVTYI